MWRGFQNTLGPGGLGVPQQVFERLSRGQAGERDSRPAFSEMDRGFKALNALKEASTRRLLARRRATSPAWVPSCAPASTPRGT
jgi:hypothetical protein